MIALRGGGEVHVQPLQAGDWQAPLRSWLATRERRRWRVWLGGRRCKLHLVEPIAGVRSIEEAEAVLGASLSENGQPVAAHLAVWSPRGGESWVTSTVAANLVDELADVLASRQGRLATVRPWWTAAKPLLRNAVMCDEEAVSYWRSDERGQITSAATVIADRSAQLARLQRLRVTGQLDGWRLALRANPAGHAAGGFAIDPLEEDADAAPAAAV
jgi:hypothetical protein